MSHGLFHDVGAGQPLPVGVEVDLDELYSAVRAKLADDRVRATSVSAPICERDSSGGGGRNTSSRSTSALVGAKAEPVADVHE